MEARDYMDISLEVAFPDIEDELRLPPIDWYNEDKSEYPRAANTLNKKTNRKYIDNDDSFLMSPEGAFLMNEDFVFVNTHLFREAGERFERYGKYTDAPHNSFEYNQFREQEEDRRYVGYTAKCKLYKKDVYAYNSLPRNERHIYVHDVKITGEQYNFINYGRIIKVDESTIEEGSINATKKPGIADFFYSQYWWTKAKYFAKKNGFNHIVVKSRRAGWSFQEAIDSANIANLIPALTQMFTAFSAKYITEGDSIASMARTQLDFYEEFTPFNRCGILKDGTPAGLLSKDLDELVLGFKDRAGTRKGWLSKLISIPFGPANPDAAIGKDAITIKVEEMSNAPNFDAFMEVTEPTTTAGAFKTGMIIGFGTGGSKEGNWQAFKNWYLNPALYDAMPFANIWDDNARTKKVGFYKPYIQNLQGFDDRGVSGIDQYGNPNYVASIRIYRKERQAKKDNPDTSNSAYLRYCGQRSNSPTESFTISSDNTFSSEGLTAHYKRLLVDDSLKFYRDGWVDRDANGKAVFKTNAQLNSEGITIHDYLNNYRFKPSDDVYGCLREWYPPYKDELNQIPKNLYRIYYDGVAIDKDIKSMRSDSSLDSVIVYMVPNNIVPGGGDQIVARYVGRTGELDKTNRFILDLADYYNAKVLPEIDRGDIVQAFKRWKRRDRLVATPIHVFDTKVKDGAAVSYGIQIGGGGLKKANGITYSKQWLYTKRALDEEGNQLYNYHFVYDLPLIQEYINFDPVDGNFDGISTMILQAYDVQEMILVGTKPKETKKKGNSIFNKPWYPNK